MKMRLVPKATKVVDGSGFGSHTDKAPFAIREMDAVHIGSRGSKPTKRNVRCERMIMAILRLLATLLVILVACGWGTAQTNIISFGLPFVATQSEPCPRYPEGLCLADSVGQCYEVALISSKGVCRATTSYRFRYEVPGGSEFEATLLEGLKECLELPNVAVVGVDAGVVRVIPLSEDKSPVPRDLERKARRLLEEWQPTSYTRIVDIEANSLSNAPPKLLKAGQMEMLRFELNERSKHWKRDRGPAMLLLNGQLFRLEGWCTDDHRFFSVKNTFYFAYTLHCCGCGERILYVYDLSGETPKMVYENEKLSD